MTLTDNYTLNNILKNSINDYPDNEALCVLNGSSLSYKIFGENVSKTSFYLIKEGIVKGDKIAILGENSPSWVISFWAVTCIGAICVPILPDFSTKEINNILSHSESKILFISKNLLHRNPDIEFDGKIIILNEFSDKKTEKSIFENIDTKKISSFNFPDVEDDDIASLIYTSGTTGRSKGVLLTHKNLSYVSQQGTSIQNVISSDVFLSILPLSHVYENVLGMILPLRKGAKIVYMNRPPTPTLLAEAMKSIRPTTMLIVPLIIEKIYHTKVKPALQKNAILRNGMHIWPIRYIMNNIAGRKLMKGFGGRVRFLGIGGAGLDWKTEQFMRDANIPYSCGYGLTETSSLIFGSKVGKVKARSVGQPLPGVDFKIIKPKSSDEIGEIIVRSQGNMKGYYKQPDATSAVLTDGNWFHTGDLGCFKNNALYLKGRSKTMILGPSGENIYPEEIESEINQMDGVVESLVYESKGKIMAKVFFNIDEISKKYEFFKEAASYHTAEVHHNITRYLKDMCNRLNSQLGKYSQVSELILVSQPFEKTPTNKIKRHNIH